jgi:RHS repeat-associated protein
MTDATGSTHYAYDAVGRLVTVTDPDGGATTAGYDAAGQRISLTYPSGLTLGYSYDLNGRLAGLHDPRAGDAAYALDPDGRLLTEQLPARLARRYHYEHGLLRRFDVIRDGHQVTETVFTRDPNGRILTQRDGTRLGEYRYDLAGQLVFTGWRDTAAPEGYRRPGAPDRPGPLDEQHLVYDAVGNRTSLRHGATETRYRYDAADQLLASETSGRPTEYRYDSCGRLIEETAGDEHRVISYDGFGVPAAIARSRHDQRERIQTVFNGDGLLTSVRLTASREHRDDERAASVHYRWGSISQIPQIFAQRAEPGLDDAERDRAGRLNADFAYGYGRTFASWEHGSATFHHDAFGSAIRTEDTEAWVQAERYDPFGVPESAGQPGTTPGDDVRPPELPRFGYRGELAFGPLIYLRARFYDTPLGRFTTRDPLTTLTGPAQARNPYVYAANDPLRFIDPLGTFILVPGGRIGELARPTTSQPTHSGVPGTVAISPHVLVSAADPKVKALQAAWRWVVSHYGAPTSAEAEFSDWVRLCALRPYGFTCQGLLALDFTGFNMNFSLEGAFHAGIKIILASAGAGAIGGFLFPLSGGIRNVPNPVQMYEVGPYKPLINRSVPGDDLQIHHVPQGNPAGQVIDGYDYINAPSIALPNGEHFNIPNLKGTYTGTPQELIARDIQNLRDYTNASEESIQALIDLIRSLYPGILTEEGESAEGGAGAEGGPLEGGAAGGGAAPGE